jgi:hypothetical protein
MGVRETWGYQERNLSWGRIALNLDVRSMGDLAWGVAKRLAEKISMKKLLHLPPNNLRPRSKVSGNADKCLQGYLTKV